MNRPAETVPALDGVRGLAFVMVVLQHANEYLQRPWFLVDGQVGVWLFFVLSSYLLARPFFAAEPAALLQPATWARYGLGRFLRIYPLFIVYVFCLWWLARVPAGKCLRVFFLETTQSVDWSLYIEFRFYFLLPLLIIPVGLGLARFRYVAFLLGLTLVLTCLYPFWGDYRTWPFASAGMNGWSGNGFFLGYLNCFLPGVLAAYISVKAPAAGRWRGIMGDVLGIVILIVSLVVPLLRLLELPGLEIDYARFIHLWFPYSVLFAAWLYTLSSRSGVFARLLALRPIRFLGAISYPGYLFHVFIYRKMRSGLPENDPAFLLCSLLLLVAISYLLHIALEKPIYRLRHGRPKGRDAATS